jgi:SAM-dependent methyltransferase
MADQRIGMEPAEPMLQWTAAVAPESEFVVGAAEAMPFSKGSIDLMTAAGSLNYVNLDLFFAEAIRVLARQGVLVVYDFSQGKAFRQGLVLEQWFSIFEQRYPPAPQEAQPLDPTILARFNSGFRVRSQVGFEVGVALSLRSYLDYVMTETNVAYAVRNGVPLGEIRSWCEDTLGPLWMEQTPEVVFPGYFACMTPISG